MAKKKKSQKQDSRGYGQPPSTGTTSRQQSTVHNTHKSTASSSLASLNVTSSTQQQLQNVLQSFENQNGVSSSVVSSSATGTTGPSDRFFKRLATVYDRLRSVSFTDAQLERVVQALGYDITLESAVDWLCGNVSTEELPPLFTEGQVRDDITSTSSSTTLLEVLAPPPFSSSAVSSHIAVDAPHVDPLRGIIRNDGGGGSGGYDEQQQNEHNDDDDVHSSSHKAWILQQYQFATDDDDEEDEHEENEIDKEMKGVSITHSRDKNHSSAHLNELSSSVIPPLTTAESSETVPMEPLDSQLSPAVESTTALDSSPLLPLSPEECELQSLRRELEHVQADANDPASNYMRSKHENKQLQQRLKQLRQHVSGLERKVTKKQQPNPPETGVDAAVVGGESTPVDASCPPQVANEDEGGLFDLFEEPSDTVNTHVKSSPLEPPTDDASEPETFMEFPEDAFKTWTGKTPRQLLHEYCRKHKIPKPVYSLDRNRCTVTVKLPTRNVDAELPGLYRSSSNDARMAQEYVATRMLYLLQSDRPLYRLLPTFFSDLWKEWEHAELEVHIKTKETAKSERNQRIQDLIDLIASRTSREPPDGPGEDVATIGDVPPSDIDLKERGQDRNAATSQSDLATDRANARLRSMFSERCLSDTYKKMLYERSKLPIHPFRDHILHCIDKNPVTIVSAETGAGKSTNCGQFILEEALQNDTYASILCTQPRRVAATSVAERVAEEMGEPYVGELVGYQIRMESRRSSDTRLLFCTTGVVLRRLVDDPTLSGVTHVLVDEVHERQWQIDILLISLRNLLAGPRPDLKVVLMSATLDAQLFCSFFGGAPLVSVPGRTFPVTSYYLEDLLEETGHAIEEGSYNAIRDIDWKENETRIWITTRGGEKKKETHTLGQEQELSGDFEGYSLSTQRSMERVNESIVNYDLIEDTLKVLLLEPTDAWKILEVPSGANLKRGSVLVFLPGFGEIKTLAERLESSRVFGRRESFDIIPMHSTLSSADQRRAFRLAPSGSSVRKIILATNIAETSVTIPDVVFVIDTGRVRELRHDTRTSTPKLLTTWCSKASTKQRAGRAGRVQPGLCLKLFSSRTERLVMQGISEPELLRIPLEEVCLNILATGLTRHCKTFLAGAPQVPSERCVDTALGRLKEIGAVTVCETYEELTPLGRHLARLPVDARVGKMLIYGAIFKCVDPISTIAACLSASKSVFMSSMGETSQAKAMQSKFNHPLSDFLTLVNVYESFLEADSLGTVKRFCQQHFLNYTTLREIRDAKSQFVDLLCGIGFLHRETVGFAKVGRRLEQARHRSCSYNTNGGNESLVHSVILAGVYPNLGRLRNHRSVANPNKPTTLEQRSEMLEVHSSSVNYKLPVQVPSLWIAFDEKFGTSSRRITVSTTCFVDPMSVLLFASSLTIKHFDRKVIVDEWIELGVAAQTAVMIRHIRTQLDRLLTSYFDQHLYSKQRLGLAPNEDTGSSTVASIVKLITNST